MAGLLTRLSMPLVGILAAVTTLTLSAFGNPENMGFCVACFLRDTAGALGFHGSTQAAYLRPEVIGIVLGAFLFSAARKEFAPRGGSAPLSRFVLGFCLMVGALVFLGCPLRMMTRIAGGDLNAVVGLAGFAAGIFAGVFFLNRGFTLKRTYDVTKTDGYLLPIAALVLLLLLVVLPGSLVFSETGPGSMRAPLLMALAAGLIMGAAGFATRLCFVAGIRDSVLFRDFAMFGVFAVFIAVVFVGNLFLGSFNPGFQYQSIAHTEGLWNFLGMMLVGLCSVLLGGCPFKQVVLAGSGNSDSAVTVLGMTGGAAFAHNFDLASSAAGVTANGKIGLALFFALTVSIAILNTAPAKR